MPANMDETSTILLVQLAAGSFGVGVLGAVLGIGGGTLLVPFLVLVTGMDPVVAVGISLFCVIGTSIGGASRALQSGQANLRLALTFEPWMMCSAVFTAYGAHKIDGRWILFAFAFLLFGLAILFLRLALQPYRLGPISPTGEPEFWDGVCPEPDGSSIAYRPQKVPAMTGLVFATGALSGLLGIGGGALNVAYLTILGRVPLRAAASTSVLTMLVTGAAAGAVHLSQGKLPGAWIAISMLSVVPGSILGARLQKYLPERSLRLLFAFIALSIGLFTLLRTWPVESP